MHSPFRDACFNMRDSAFFNGSTYIISKWMDGEGLWFWVEWYSCCNNRLLYCGCLHSFGNFISRWTFGNTNSYQITYVLYHNVCLLYFYLYASHAFDNNSHDGTLFRKAQSYVIILRWRLFFRANRIRKNRSC